MTIKNYIYIFQVSLYNIFTLCEILVHINLGFHNNQFYQNYHYFHLFFEPYVFIKCLSHKYTFKFQNSQKFIIDFPDLLI